MRTIVFKKKKAKNSQQCVILEPRFTAQIQMSSFTVCSHYLCS